MTEREAKVREHIDLWLTENKMAGDTAYRLQGEEPPEKPIAPGCTVRLELARYHPGEGWAEGLGPVGVVAGLSYGRPEAADRDRNHWYYHVIWEQEEWEFPRADGAPARTSFASGTGSIGWPHPWRHDYLVVVRNPWLTDIEHQTPHNPDVPPSECGCDSCLCDGPGF